MKCPTCGSEIPDKFAKCADCKKLTRQLDQGKKVYCPTCAGKRKLAGRQKAVKAKEDKAVKAAEDK